MNPNRARSQSRRRPLFRIEAEVLESRQLLTGGAGNTFALMNGTIPTANGTATNPFVVESGHFTVPKGRFTLGIDVVAATSSTVAPKIAALSEGAQHVAIQGVAHNPRTTANTPNAVLATVNLPNKSHTFSASFTTKVAATGKTSGDYLLGYYLPGDANGDGKVDKTDLTLIKSLVGKTVNDTAYQFDADSNRDGKVTMADYNIAKKNLGVTTTITPDFTANLDPNAQTASGNRITAQSTVAFTGTAAPGATVTYSQPGDATTTATADASGNYTIKVPLVPGTNNFSASSVDGFGQTISGTITPLTYVAPASTTATTTTSTTTTATTTAPTTTTTTPAATTTTTTTTPTTTTSTSTTTGTG